MDLAAAAAGSRVLDDRSDPAPAPGTQAFVAALSHVRCDGVLCRRLRLRDRAGRLGRHTRTRRGRPTHRRRRTSAQHPVRRLGKPDGRARARTRRVRVGHRTTDRPRGRPHDTGVRVRPRRPWAQRRRPRRGCRARPACTARARTCARAVRHGRTLARRHVRVELRRPLSVPGRRRRAPGLHAPAPVPHRCERHGPRAGRGAHPRAYRHRPAARRPEGRRTDGTGTAVRTRRRADARTAEPGGEAARASETAPWASSPPARTPSRDGPRTRTTSPRCPATAFTERWPGPRTSR